MSAGRLNRGCGRCALRSPERGFCKAFAVFAIALAVILAVPASRPAFALDRAVEPVVNEIVTNIQLLVRPGWIARDEAEFATPISLTFLSKGEPAPSASCTGELREHFEKQVALLADHVGIRFRIVPMESEPKIHIVIGDTYLLTNKNSGEVPLAAWWELAERRSEGRASTRNLSLSPPAYFSTIWLEGLYQKSNGVLFYGRLLVDWNGTNMRTRELGRICEFNFIEHLAWLFSLDQLVRFDAEVDSISDAAKKRAGIVGHRDYIASADVQMLIVGSLFCSSARPTIETSALTACARQIVDLVNQFKR